MCDDFVWDPTLEDLRNRKIDTGTFSSKTIHARLPSFGAVASLPVRLGADNLQVAKGSTMSF